MSPQDESLEAGMAAAIEEAKASLAQGGIPIGAALADADGSVLGRGHNQRIQRDSQILHAELDCLAEVGRRADYPTTTLYSTLMPCYMCAGAAIQFGIRKVVVGESRNFGGAATLLRDRGIDLIDLDLDECVRLLSDFIAANPGLWSEDIGD